MGKEVTLLGLPRLLALLCIYRLCPVLHLLWLIANMLPELASSITSMNTYHEYLPQHLPLANLPLHMQSGFTGLARHLRRTIACLSRIPTHNDQGATPLTQTPH